jgi:hypothetical protein
VYSFYPNRKYFIVSTFCSAMIGLFRLVVNRVTMTISLTLLLSHFAPKSIFAGCGASLEDGAYVRHLSSLEGASSDSFSKFYVGRVVYFDGKLLLSTSLAISGHDKDSSPCIRCHQLPGSVPAHPSLTSSKPIQSIRADEGIRIRGKDISTRRELESDLFAVQVFSEEILRPPRAI